MSNAKKTAKRSPANARATKRVASKIEERATHGATKMRETRGDRIIRFAHTLKVPDGPEVGRPLRLRDWQCNIIKGIYDPVDPKTHRRIVREAVLSMGRKNAKTAKAAILCLSHLIGPEAMVNSQLYSAAFDHHQAALVYNSAANMVHQDDELDALIRCTDSMKRMQCRALGTVYRALSAESRSKHGLNPTFVVFDELAQFHANRELYDVLKTSMGAQAEALFLTISTQAADDTALLSQLIDYGLAVQRGEVNDPTFKLFLYALPSEADPFDESLWIQANPALGDFRSLDELRQYAARAKQMPSLLRTLMNLYLNMRVAGSIAFISPEVWKQNGSPVDIDALAGRDCYAALDLSGRFDLTSLTLTFPDYETGTYDVVPFFWTPEGTLDERTKRDRVPYRDWVEMGYLEATPGKSIDYKVPAAKVAELRDRYNILGLGYDRWRMDIFKKYLEAEGIGEDDLKMIPLGQGYKDMTPAVDAVEETLINGLLRHGGHPVLTWNAANAVVSSDPAGNRKLVKDKSFGRIDGMITLAMSLVLAQSVMQEQASRYEERGLIQLGGS